MGSNSENMSSSISPSASPTVRYNTPPVVQKSISEPKMSVPSPSVESNSENMSSSISPSASPVVQKSISEPKMSVPPTLHREKTLQRQRQILKILNNADSTSKIVRQQTVPTLHRQRTLQRQRQILKILGDAKSTNKI